MITTLVIGAGQAGLAAGYHLQRAGIDFRILEGSAQPGGAWPSYYDSLRLFSPARFSSLPGLSFPGDGERYPTRDEVIAYLRGYAQHFALPIQTSTRVAQISRHGAGFAVQTSAGTLHARSIIAATGAFHRPHVPTLPGQDTFQGQILHSAAYQTPESFAGQRVIVVGAGNSAVQIAAELARVATVTLATRELLRFQAQRPWGRDIHWWWWLTGFDRLPLGNRLGAWVQRQAYGMVLDTGVYQAAIAAGTPTHAQLFTAFTPTGVCWADGRDEAVDAVIFATGYRPNLDYLNPLGALDAEGQPLHRGGLSTTVPGLAYVGLNQQRTFASATLRGVGPDAAYVVARLQQHLAPARCCWRSPRLGRSTS